ncbi:MAG: tetratricopeptide repeat protein [Thermodesulfovibrionales bacterium]
MARSSRKKRKAAGESAARISGSGPSQSPVGTGSLQEVPAHKTRGTSLLAASASFITFIVYLSSLRDEFIFRWDDGLYILDNPFIGSFNATLFKRAFFNFYAANWHPLTWISHALDYALWGLNPLGHHLTNNILHAVNTFLVVVLVARLLDTAKALEGRFSDKGILIAAATSGLLFGIHPLHVESVAWVAERKDVLCALFYLLSIMAYTGYVGRGGSLWPPKEGQPRGVAPTRTYILSLGFFTLALLSKPMAVSLPVVLLILDWYPLKRIQSMKSFWSELIEKLPFLALSLVSSVLTILAQKAGGAMAMTESVPLSTRLLVAVQSLISYLWKMLLPVNLSPYYPYPKEVSLLSWEYLSAIVLGLGITAACVVIAKKQKVWLSAWGYYVMTLIPVIGIVQVGGQAMADRYMYLPCLGPFLVIGLAVAWIYEKGRAAERQYLAPKFAAAGAVLFLFVPMTYLTVKQIDVWKNDITLWTYVIEKQPAGVPQAYNNLGLTFIDMGLVDRAMEEFDKALAVDPGFYEAYNNRGSSLDKMGQPDRGIADFDKAIALNPRYAAAYYNRGIAYGKIGLLDNSIESFDKALEIDSNNAEAYVSRGISYARIGRHDKALEDFNKAILLKPTYAMAYFNRGNFHSLAGNKELAVSDFQKACDFGEKQGCDALQAFRLRQ